MTPQAQLKSGLVYAISAFTLWGLVPIYFKAVSDVSELEILSHRVIWSVAFLSLFLITTGQWGKIKNQSLSQLRPYLFSAILISFNWFVFIWAVAQDKILESSLGYFINPLVSIVLGMIFLGERLRGIQVVAVLCALFGVLNQLWLVGSLPWVAISLALSFGCYGLIRKTYPINSALGLFIETSFMLPFALAYLLWLGWKTELDFGYISTQMDILLIFSGIVTSLPLLLFAASTQRLSLNLVGMAQYITPSMSFLLAIFIYHEPFDKAQLLTFCWIWLGLAIFTGEGIYRRRNKRPLLLTEKAS